jgi:hypothetical protein
MIPRQPFSLGKRSRYPLIFVVVVSVLVAAIRLMIPAAKQSDYFLPAVASAAGFAYFLYNQHLQETRLFADLFRQFNERYDHLNGALNRIAAEQNVSMLDANSKLVLYDYFNLCAEEFLYFKTGFIDPEVWASWSRGMAHFASVSHIRELWVSELQGGSYYGFTLADLT